MPGESSPEEMKEIGGGHLHHKEQPVMPELLGEEPGTRFKTEWARGSAKRALGGKSAKKEVLEEEIEKLSSQPLKELLRSYIRLPEQILRTEEGRRNLLEKERFIREELIGKGEVEGKDKEVAEKLISAIGRKIEKLGEPEAALPVSGTEEATETEIVQVLKSIEEEIKKGQTLSEVIAKATQKSAAATIPEITTRVRTEIKEAPGKTPKEKQAAWLRQRIEQLESLEIPFESYPNTQTVNEIHSVLGEVSPDLQEEYWARHFLHNYALESPSGIEAAKTKAGLISITSLQQLTRIPGVAVAFQEYERRARREKEIYETGKQPKELSPEQKLITAVGGEVNEIRKKIAEEVEKQLGIKNGSAAQTLAERIWHITGRSSYWDAFILVRKEKKDEDGEVIITHEPFQGGGQLAGPMWLKRLFNFPAYVQFKQKKGFDFPTHMDLGLRDFWSRSAKPLGISTEEELKENDRWVGTLEKVDISKLEFVETLDEAAFIRAIIHAGYADNSRKLLTIPGGFLEVPNWENFAKLVDIFENLPIDERQEKLGEILKAMIEFNRRGTLGGSKAKEHFPDWVPWDRETIETITRNAMARNLISKEAGNEILSEFLGGWVKRTARREAGFGLSAAGKSLLEGLGEILKSVLK